MSSRAMGWAWMQDVKPGPKFILVALADRANENGECFPRIRWIAAKTGFSKAATKSNLKILHQLKKLEVTRRMRSDKSFTSNLYRLAIPREFALTEKQQIILEEGDGESDFYPGRSESDTGRLESSPGRLEPNHHNTSNYTSTKTSKKEEKIAPDGADRPPSSGKRSAIPKPLPTITDETWAEYQAMRARKKAPLTDYVLKRLKKYLAALSEKGHSPEEVLETAIERNWTGLKVNWITDDKKNRPASTANSEQDLLQTHPEWPYNTKASR